jgi:hypothetical protein
LRTVDNAIMNACANVNFMLPVVVWDIWLSAAAVTSSRQAATVECVLSARDVFTYYAVLGMCCDCVTIHILQASLTTNDDHFWL